MSDLIFEHPPRVELLRFLTMSASLRQTDVLSMAIRLWVILRSLYGSSSDPVYLDNLNNSFTYPDWRDSFFEEASTHHQGDAIATKHSSHCPCSKTITDWLFDPQTGIPEIQWLEEFNQHYSLSKVETERILNPVAWVYNPASEQTATEWRKAKQKQYQLSKSEVNELVRIVKHPERELHKNRPFACSRKSLKKDLKTLVKLGWLKAVGDYTYQKVQTFPPLSLSNPNAVLENAEVSVTGSFIHSDLADIADNFSQPINGVQRFFLHVEYIVPSKLFSQVENLQGQLKQIWSQTPVSTVLLKYCSAKLYQDEVERIVYPVCICYFKRAPYLFAFGQVPKDEDTIDWYDYRLDRIRGIQQLNWQDPSIPPSLRESCLGKPPTPQQISEMMAEAFGFEFYKPKEKMLLRFNRYFDANYIEGTERDSLFKKISYQRVLREVKNASLSGEQKQSLLKIVNSRSPQDIYRQVNYRVEDNNVIMRLRAWGSKVEVILPLELREQMRTDLKEAWNLYQ